MKNQKFKGLWVVAACIFSLMLIAYSRGQDRYTRQFSMNNFRQLYIKGYSGDSSALHYYYPKADDTVKLITKGPLSLKPANYDVEVQYAAKDDTTVLKIFASDYISPDNSGGKVFVQHKIDPAQSSLKLNFELDQQVDSLFITFETLDEEFTIGRVNASSDRYAYTDTWRLMAFTVIACAALLYVINTQRSFTKGFVLGKEEIPASNTALLIIAVMAAAVFVSCLPLMDTGILLGHDTRFHLNRIDGIARGLQSGQFPVRIHGGILNDYGYPNSLFYPELLLYFPAVLTLMGVSVYSSFKLYIILINILTVTVGYVAFKKLSGSRYIGLTAAVVYLLLPYRILCVYWRCAIGEATAMTFLPLVIYGLYAVVYGNRKDWPYLVVGAGGVLQSHILTTEMTALFALVFVLFGIKNMFTKEKRYIYLILAAVATVLTNLWFLGPMVLMMLQLGLVIFGRVPLTAQKATYDVSFLFSMNKVVLAGPYMIGLILLFAAGGYLVYRTIYMHKEKEHFKICDNMLFMFVVFSVMTTAIFPWRIVEKIPLIGAVVSAIQFPTRMLTVVQLCGMIIMVFLLKMLFADGRKPLLICTVLIATAITTNLFLIEYSVIGNAEEKIESKHHFENNIDNQFSVGQAEYLVAGNNMDEMIANPPVMEFDNQSVTVTNFSHYGTVLTFDYTIADGGRTTAIIPVTYIPNYEVMVNGEKVQPDKNPDARVKFPLSAQSGHVEVRYTSPLTFRLFEAVSLISIALFILQKKLMAFIPVKK